ncbi:cytochrome P450 [Sporichthya sp.]|uniref:cytochrome P450 n=1 Tax=Sporichthya sp. TaxID=65475 RepID=UPI0017FC1267|nr:cytochrome P450 [Sporichthya sp.]MBA3741439.1 cytochrome P450 [Sporichthya sp.]
MSIQDDDEVVAPLTSCPVAHVRGSAAATAALRSKDLRNSDQMWAGIFHQPGVESETCLREFVKNDITFTNGEAHRTRRKLLNQLVRPAALDLFRDEILEPQSVTLLPRFVTGPDADGRYRANLNPFCDRLFLHFAAKFVGLVGLDTDDQMERLRTLVSPITAAFSSAFYDNRAEIHAAALDAKAKYIEEYYYPSLEAQRLALKEKDAAGPDADPEPMNFLQLVASGAHPDYLDEQQAIRESLILFNASVGTSTQTIINCVADLSAWLEEHPGDRVRCEDDKFLFAAMEESLRLRSPFAPYLFRLAARDTRIGDQDVIKGQEVHISIPAANRDTAVWGPDAAAFNPLRTTPGDLRAYGLGFSVGPHQCLGQRVVMGSDGTGGAHLRVLSRLFAVGVRPDPDNPPAILPRSAKVVQPTDDAGEPIDVVRWTSFPVVFDRWDPQAEAANATAP